MSTVRSVEVGHGAWTADWAERSSVPGNSILFGCWAKADNPDTTYPMEHGNFNILGLNGSNWSVLFIMDNMTINSNHTVPRYNTNAMVFGNNYFGGADYANDYAIYTSYEVQTEAEALGWKWIGCQVVWTGSNLTLRLWMKFGLSGTMTKLAEQTVSLATLRSDLISNAGWSTAAANAWTPSDLARVQIGSDTDGSGIANGFACYAKMYSQSSEPTTSELNTIATNFSADSAAWSDWSLLWVSGAAVLSDRSGNSRALSVGSGGALYQGDEFDNGVSSSSFLKSRYWADKAYEGGL